MSERKWTYYSPAFDCEKHQPEVYVYSPWEGHRRFAYDYVRCIQPSVIVALVRESTPVSVLISPVVPLSSGVTGSSSSSYT